MAAKGRKPKVPAIYTSKAFPGIQMPTSKEITKDKFMKLWKGTRNAKGADLESEWTAFRTWRSRFRN